MKLLLAVLLLALMVVYSLAIPAAASEAELLENGGFEQGQDLWQVIRGEFSLVESPIYEGNYAAEFTLTEGVEGFIYQDLDINSFAPGESYNLVGYCSVEEDPNIERIFLRVRWYDELGNLICQQEDSLSPSIEDSSEPQNVENAIQEMFSTEPQPVLAKVIRIIDGDTIEVEIDGVEYKVRYIGIDTPENGEPFYEEATNENGELVEGKLVYLKKDVRDKDDFGRLLRYVIVDDNGEKVFVNAELVRLGYAWPYPCPPDTKYQDLFSQLALEAIQARSGIWASLPPEDIGQIEEELKFHCLSVTDILAPDKAYKVRIEAGVTRMDVTQPATVYFDDLSFSGPKPPPRFYGMVTITNPDESSSIPAPDGYTVSAEIDGEERGSCQIADGEYSLDVDGKEGDIIHFYVQGVDTGQTAVWKAGEFTELDLKVVDDVPPSLPTGVAITTTPSDNTPSFTWDPATDALAGVAGYYIRIDDTEWTWIGDMTSWTSADIVSDGDHTFFVKAKDSVDNEGGAGSVAFSISYSVPPPSNGSEVDDSGTAEETPVLDETQEGTPAPERSLLALVVAPALAFAGVACLAIAFWLRKRR